jgi:CubicO group peptidase (beta-lactamase class C family)
MAIPTQSSINLDPDHPAPNDPRRNPFTDDASSSSFNQRVVSAMAHWHVPGLAISIIDNNHIISHGYGVARLSSRSNQSKRADAATEDGEVSVTPKTLFNCASMSKSFTSAAMALLVEDEEMKEVKWSTPVSKLCEDFVFSEEAMTEAITVEDILCHRSGLPGYVLALW